MGKFIFAVVIIAWLVYGDIGDRSVGMVGHRVDSPSKGLTLTSENLPAPSGTETFLVKEGWIWNTYESRAVYTKKDVEAIKGHIAAMEAQVDTWEYYEKPSREVAMKYIIAIIVLLAIGGKWAHTENVVAVSMNPKQYRATLVNTNALEHVRNTCFDTIPNGVGATNLSGGNPTSTSKPTQQTKKTLTKKEVAAAAAAAA